MIRRKASEFDDLFAGAFPLNVAADGIVADWSEKRRRVRHYRALEEAENDAPSVSELESAPQAQASMNLEDARKAWDGASFMVQAYGAYLNFQIEIFHAKIKAERAKKPEQLVTDFLREFRMYVKRNKETPGAKLHTIYVHRRDGLGNLVTRIVAHLPRCKDDPVPWIKSFFRRGANAEAAGDAVTVDIGVTDDWQRHLQLIRGICAGLKPLKPEDLSFLRRTRINVGSVGWETAGKPPRLSRWIDKQARDAASQDLAVLSAFDDDGVNPCSGWERAEFEYRRTIVAERGWLEEAAHERMDEGLSLRALRERWQKTRASREALRPGFHKL